MTTEGSYQPGPNLGRSALLRGAGQPPQCFRETGFPWIAGLWIYFRHF
jgi:hypothetical protein